MDGFKTRLELAMQRAGYSGSALASAVGVHRVRIYQLLDLPEVPKAAQTLVTISDVLGVSLDWLLKGGTPEPAVLAKVRRLQPHQLQALEELVDAWLASLK